MWSPRTVHGLKTSQLRGKKHRSPRRCFPLKGRTLRGLYFYSGYVIELQRVIKTESAGQNPRTPPRTPVFGFCLESAGV